MSRSTNSDIVNNVAYVGDNAKIFGILSHLDEDLYEWKYTNRKKGKIPTANIDGWEISPGGKVGKKKSLFADRCQKDDRIVFLLNTSEYASVGEFDYVVFSDDREAVESFLKDIDVDSKIEDVDSVCQTL